MPDSAAKKAWKANNTTRVVMSLNNNTDADIIHWLIASENKQGYIKSLIRADMEKQRGSTRGMTRLQRDAYHRFCSKAGE